MLRARIGNGTMTGRVPSAATIAQQYEVAKGTAERALAILREEGLIRSVMGGVTSSSRPQSGADRPLLADQMAIVNSFAYPI